MNKIIIVLFSSMFLLQGIAEAASISKRVRTLEAKVHKQEQQIRQQLKSQKQLIKKTNEGQEEIDDLQFQVKNLTKKSESNNQKLFDSDTSYSFP